MGHLKTMIVKCHCKIWRVDHCCTSCFKPLKFIHSSTHSIKYNMSEEESLTLKNGKNPDESKNDNATDESIENTKGGKDTEEVPEESVHIGSKSTMEPLNDEQNKPKELTDGHDDIIGQMFQQQDSKDVSANQEEDEEDNDVTTEDQPEQQPSDLQDPEENKETLPKAVKRSDLIHSLPIERLDSDDFIISESEKEITEHGGNQPTISTQADQDHATSSQSHEAGLLVPETIVASEPQIDPPPSHGSTLDLESQEKPIETTSSTHAPPKDYPNALIQFHKIINDRIEVTDITNNKNNLYVGTKNGDIYHLIHIESDFILISKTSLYENEESTYSIDKIVVLKELEKVLVHSNAALTFLNSHLQRLKNKQLFNVADVSLLQNDLTFFQKHIIRTFNAVNLKLVKKIDFSNIVKGVKFESLAMVLNGDDPKALSYDLIDFLFFSKIPILTLTRECVNPLIRVLEFYKIFFITFNDVTPMGVLVNFNGDIVNSINFEYDPLDVFITKDQFIIVSFEDSICSYYPLHDEIKLVDRMERKDNLKLAKVEDVWTYSLCYTTEDGKQERLEVSEDVVLYNDDFVEIYKFNKLETLLKCDDLSLVNAQISHTNDELLSYWRQLRNIIVLGKFQITDELEDDFLYYILGIKEHIRIFHLLSDKIIRLKDSLQTNKIFESTLKSHLKNLLSSKQTETPLLIKLLFLSKFRDDFHIIQSCLKFLPSEDNESIIQWFQDNNQLQLLLNFYKLTNQIAELKVLYKMLIISDKQIDPQFDKYDPSILPLFQDDLETLQRINRLNLINIQNFNTDDLLKFVKHLKIESQEQEDFFWSVSKKISVKQNQILNLERLKKSLLKGELKRLKK